MPSISINAKGLCDLTLSPVDLETLHKNFHQLRSFVVRIEDSTVVQAVGSVLRNITSLYVCKFVYHCDLEDLGPARSNSEFLSMEKVKKELKLEKIFEVFPKLGTLRLGAGLFLEDHLIIIKDKLKNLNFLQLKGATRESKCYWTKRLKA